VNAGRKNNADKADTGKEREAVFSLWKQGKRERERAVERALEFSVLTRPVGSKIRRKEKRKACVLYAEQIILSEGGINCENNVNLRAVIYSQSDLTLENSKLMRIKKMTVLKTLLLCISIDF